MTAEKKNTEKQKKIIKESKSDDKEIVKEPVEVKDEKSTVRLKKSVKKESEEAVIKDLPKKVQKEPLKVLADSIYATGRRKESTAKVWLFKGSGTIKINHVDPLYYLGCERLVNTVLEPLNVLNLNGKYDVRVDIKGGGLTGQAQAANLGIARALLILNEDSRADLKKEGFLTQDSREKERKKYGKRGARKSPQYRKR